MQRLDLTPVTSSEPAPPEAVDFTEVDARNVAEFREKLAQALQGPAKFDAANYLNDELIDMHAIIRTTITLAETKAYIQYLLQVLNHYKNILFATLAIDDNDSHELAIKIGDALLWEKLSPEQALELADIYYDCAVKFSRHEDLNYKLLGDCTRLSKKFRHQLEPFSQENLHALLMTFALSIEADISAGMLLHFVESWCQFTSVLGTTSRTYSSYSYEVDGKQQSVAERMLNILLPLSGRAVPPIFLEKVPSQALAEYYESLLSFCKENPALESFTVEIKNQYDSLGRLFLLQNEIENLQTEMINLENDTGFLPHYDQARITMLQKKIELAELLNKFELSAAKKSFEVIKNYKDIILAKCLLGDVRGALQVYGESQEICGEIAYLFQSDDALSYLSEYREVVMFLMDCKRNVKGKNDQMLKMVKELMCVMYPTQKNIEDMVVVANKLFDDWKEKKNWHGILELSNGLLKSCLEKLELYEDQRSDSDSEYEDDEETDEDDYDNLSAEENRGILLCMVLMKIMESALENIPVAKFIKALVIYRELVQKFSENVFDYEERLKEAEQVLYIQKQVARDIKVVNEYYKITPTVNPEKIEILIDYLNSVGYKTSNDEMYIISWKVFADVKKVFDTRVPETYLLTLFDITEILDNKTLKHGLYQVLKKRFLNNAPSADATEPKAEAKTAVEQKVKEPEVVSLPAVGDTTVKTFSDKAAMSKPAIVPYITASQLKSKSIEEDLRRKKIKKEADRRAELARREEAEKKKIEDKIAFTQRKAMRAKEIAVTPRITPPETLMLSPRFAPASPSMLAARKTETNKLTPDHIFQLNKALHAICEIKILLAKPPEQLDVLHYALLYNMAISYQAFQRYSLLGKPADEKKSHAINSIVHKNNLLDTVMSVAGAITRDLPHANAFKETDRQEIICQLAMANVKYRVEEFVFLITETSVYKELNKFYERISLQTSEVSRANYISQLFALIYKIQNHKHSKFRDYHIHFNASLKTQREFSTTHHSEMQAISALISLLSAYHHTVAETTTHELKTFLRFCHDQAFSVQKKVNNELSCYDVFINIREAFSALDLAKLASPLSKPHSALNPNAPAFSPLIVDVHSSSGTPIVSNSESKPASSPSVSPVNGNHPSSMFQALMTSQSGFSFFSSHSQPAPSPSPSPRNNPATPPQSVFSFGLTLAEEIQANSRREQPQEKLNGAETEWQILRLDRYQTY